MMRLSAPITWRGVRGAARDETCDRAGGRLGGAAWRTIGGGRVARDAARLTPIDVVEARWSRLLAAAEKYALGGDVRRSRELLESLLPGLPPGPVRARALLVLAAVRLDNFEFGLALLEEALVEAGDHYRIRSEIELDLGAVLQQQGLFRDSMPYMSAAIDDAERAVIQSGSRPFGETKRKRRPSQAGRGSTAGCWRRSWRWRSRRNRRCKPNRPPPR